jgi:glucose/arabinose dehydrogenase
VVRVFDPEGNRVRNYATGLRNCSGLAMQPGTDNLWCVVNERDHLGPDLVPDFMTRLQDGAFYGWPWYYVGDREDPALKGRRPDLKGHVRVPEVLIQAHSSALSLAFYDHDRIPWRRLRRAARLSQPTAEDRLQGDPGAHEGWPADR